jgi:4-hydroxybenzoate polyprenyltransferase/phosphoserine phosphatase
MAYKRNSLLLHPLVVDLDGTLVHADMLHESALALLRNRPLDVLRIPFWLFKGKASLKQSLASRTEFSPQSLPYNLELLEWLKQQKFQGRKLILCSASDKSIATPIANHLEIFDEVLASDGSTNLVGEYKAEALEQRFGRAGFDYVGNSDADLAVWKRARRAIVANASDSLIYQTEKLCEIERVFPKKRSQLDIWRRVFRVHQWMKNLLLFIPMLAAHQLTHFETWFTLTLAFISFSLCASSVYITNDLLDLESDRLHPRKRERPFASGQVPSWIGVVLAPLLLLLSASLGGYVGKSFFFWLAFYFLVTGAYSWLLKRLILVDCLALAMLYTLRIVAGTAATNIELSFWLLAFSAFLFLSLAFVKRYAELNMRMSNNDEKIHGRGYYASDASLIQMLGVGSGYASVIVLALYLNSSTVLKLYRAPEFIWGAVPIMLFWISWMWMQAHRRNMHDDPLIFAVKDKASLLSGVAFAVVLGIGAWGWPW